MKAKDWLLANGHITEITRGRLSLDNAARVEAAVRSGVHIDGYSVKPDTGSGETQSVDKVSHSAGAGRLFDVPEESRPETDWQAASSTGPVGMRTSCELCRNSLTYCHCPIPMVWVDNVRVPVTLKRRTTPYVCDWR